MPRTGTAAAEAARFLQQRQPGAKITDLRDGSPVVRSRQCRAEKFAGLIRNPVGAAGGDDAMAAFKARREQGPQ
jgi:hypothetical protein